MVEYKYDAWGNHSVQGANGTDINDASHIGSMNPFRYRGYYYDDETGLYIVGVAAVVLSDGIALFALF